jgi:hypothetical protein
MNNHFCPNHNPLYPPYLKGESGKCTCLKGDGEGNPNLSGSTPLIQNLKHQIPKTVVRIQYSEVLLLATGFCILVTTTLYILKRFVVGN